MKKLLLAVSLLAGMSVSAVELNVNDATDFEGTYVAEKPAEGGNNGEAAKYQPLQSLKIAGYSFSFTDGGHSSKPEYYYNMSTS